MIRGFRRRARRFVRERIHGGKVYPKGPLGWPTVYSEGGWKAEVVLLCTETDEKGEKYTMRIIKTVMRPDYLSPDAIPKDGELFTAFRSHNTTRPGWTIGGQY